MLHILLTDPRGSKKLVNMTLVSEALIATSSTTFTNLVVPSATNESNALIAVTETPEQIDELLRKRRAAHNPVKPQEIS